MTNEISIVSAFLAGLISFLSPCVLPLVPAYISFLAGVSVKEIQTAADSGAQRRVLLAACIFVLGFSAVFILLGASATVVGRWLVAHARWLGRIAGIVLILLGFHLTGLFRIPWLLFEQRIRIQHRRVNPISVFLVGAVFAFGWSPCVGPLLAGILALAGTQDTVGQGMFLLAVYSAGLGIPFILTAAMLERFIQWSGRFRSFYRWIEISAGVLLLAIGSVMLLGGMQTLSAWFNVFGRFSL